MSHRQWTKHDLYEDMRMIESLASEKARGNVMSIGSQQARKDLLEMLSEQLKELRKDLVDAGIEGAAKLGPAMHHYMDEMLRKDPEIVRTFKYLTPEDFAGLRMDLEAVIKKLSR